ncbi:MAG: hypothetical protein ACTSX4_09540 [Candidatus Helarchaeota archaeon]
MNEDLKPFMREVVEFISLLRASEKERYEIQKKFVTDTIKTLKDIAETINNSSDYIRNNMEKMKEMLSNEIAQLKRESSLESLISANKVLEESIEMVQRGVQIMEYRQALTGTDNILEHIKSDILKISEISKQTKITSNEIEKEKKIERPVTEKKADKNSIKSRSKQKQTVMQEIGREKVVQKPTPANLSLEEKEKETLRKIKEKEPKEKKSKKFHLDF